MRRTILALALASTAGVVRAQPPASTPIDPSRLALAHRLMVATGGAEATRRTLSTAFASMSAVLTKDMPPEQARLQSAIQQDLLDEVGEIIPSMIAQTERSYARHLSRQELADYVAWMESPSGRAVRAKAPAIQADVIAAEAPQLRAMLPVVKRRTLERVCAELKCTAADR